jgi:hypothetical protein
MIKPALSLWVVAAIVLGGCENIGPLGNPFSRAIPSAQEPIPIAANELAQCPRPSGVFQNEDSLNSGGAGLEYFFRVDGFQANPPALSSTDMERGPATTTESAVHLLGDMGRQGRQRYLRSPSERFTLEIHPLTKPSWFKIVVRSSLGKSGEGDGRLDLSRSTDNSTGNHCRDGTVLGIYSKTGKVNVAWWVDAATGDIVGASSAAFEQGKISFRHKRIGN